MENFKINEIINEVHSSIYDWCKSEARDNWSFTELLRGCQHVISEISKKVEFHTQKEKQNEQQR